MIKNRPAMHETWVLSLGQENPLEKGIDIPHVNVFQCSCLDNSMDRGPGGLNSWGHEKYDMTEQLTLFFAFKFRTIG